MPVTQKLQKASTLPNLPDGKILTTALFLSFVVLISSSLRAQNTHIVRGRVVSETNQPVLGASVVVIGSRSGVSTDSLGNFINTMVTRYKNKVKAWDVVNELFADDGVTVMTEFVEPPGYHEYRL